ncbi:hypothetical protein [Cellulomonas sp. NS3]|uniref:hypothetical protein n=1 Tax=Cellulomonas sp. NS3 TaxID=2973977 RepID=UPI0021624D1A|nr:hypothetical protein [Cellulomonas sp. NS3]
MKKQWAILGIAALVALAGAAAVRGFGSGGPGGASNVEIPPQGPWVVSITGKVEPALGCFDDPAVQTSVMSADMPTTGASGRLKPDADIEDVRRLVECLASRIDAEAIDVRTAE